MKKMFVGCILIISLILVIGCDRDDGLLTSSARQDDDGYVAAEPEAIAREIISLSGWAVDPKQIERLEVSSVTEGLVLGFTREELTPGIAHYKTVIQVGPGPYDQIGLHRVVKERKSGRPVKTTSAVFLQHGDAVAFEGIFLFGAMAPSAPLERSFAIFLAENDIDVWGIDQSWALVPAGTADLSFMEGWGMQDQIDKLGLAIAVARLSRMFTGGNVDKLHLLGYSTGGWTGYSLLNEEATRPFLLRNVRGFIAMDAMFKTDDPVVGPTLCTFADQYQGMVDAGMHAYDVPFAPIAYLAMTYPDMESPLAPPFTNMQVALAYGAATHMFAPLVPGYHYLAGEFGEDGMPCAFQFVEIQEYFEFMLTACAYEASLFTAEVAHLTCGTLDLPFDDNLADVTVPVLSMATAGGIGQYAAYTTSLLGSTDVTTLVASLYSPDLQLIDFGHIDLFISDEARTLAWDPVLAWILAHSGKEM